MSDQSFQAAGLSVAEDSGVSASAPIARHAIARGPGAVRTVILMARITFLEAARRRILWIAGAAGAAFLALFWAALHSVLRSMSPSVPPINRMEGIGMMTSLMAALISCDTLSGEIASGTIHAIATKPVDRWCLVVGKWIGFACMLALYVLYIEGGTMVIAWLEGRRITPHAAAALNLLCLQSIVLLGVTMLCSTRLSAMTSGTCSLGLYGLAFLGGWMEQFGALQHIRSCIDLGILASLIMPTDALWRKVASRIQPPILGATGGVSPFSSLTTPSTAMIVYAVVYAMVALIIAQVLFERRDL